MGFRIYKGWHCLWIGKKNKIEMEPALNDIRPNHKNPRAITKERALALAADLEKFGDLSGIVNNVNPEWTVLVSGHQRMDIFRRGKGDIVISERYDKPEKDGTVARGFINMDGRRYTYREVIWDKAKSDEATIKAIGDKLRADMVPDVEVEYDEIQQRAIECSTLCEIANDEDLQDFDFEKFDAEFEEEFA